jgi:hypothetical protein
MLKTVGFPSTRTGDQTIVNGNLVIATSGKGIDFSATPGTGTSELLSDYEEGTWTPVVVASAGGTTSGGNFTGSYTKIGRQVTVICAVENAGKNTLSGDITITGLPFTSANNGLYATGEIRYGGFSTAAGTTTLYSVVNPNTTSVAIQQFSKDDYIADLNASNLTATFNFYNVTITYFV